MGLFQLTRILMTILGVLEILLGIRFVLHLIAANAASGFTQFIYGVSGLFVAPFTGLVGTPTAGGTTFEVTTLIAMVVYALFVWIILRVIPIFIDRPSARTVSRTTREQMPGSGVERTTDIQLIRPKEYQPVAAFTYLENAGIFKSTEGKEWAIELTFDDGRKVETKDLRPDLPLIIRY